MVLKNKLEIIDSVELARAEEKISKKKAVELFQSGYLDKLDMGDIASIYYLGKKYDYKLINYYDVDKNGSVQIIKNNDINTLTLITCKKNTDKQTVFIFELNKEGKL